MQKKNIGQLLKMKKRLHDFKLLALDMDGTSLNSDGKLPLGLITFINRQNFGDLTIVFATGRMPIAVSDSLKKINISKIVISHNGAIISNLESNEIIYKRCISKKIVDFAIDLHKTFKIPLHLNLISKVVTDKLTPLSRNYADHLGINIEETNISVVNEDIISLLFISEKTHLINILKQIKNKFNDFSYVLIPDRDYWLLQILPQNTSKGNGLAIFAKMLGVYKSDIISFGDSYNDIEMIENSGIGIAMGNSCAELKKIADFITLTNDDNGVEKALQNLL